MGKTLKYGDFDFPKGNRIAIRPHTSRARPLKKGGKVPKFDQGGTVDPRQVYGYINQLPREGPGALSGGTLAQQQNVREMNQMAAGHAPFTLGGVAAALGNMLAATSGTGALRTGLASMVEKAMDVEPGSYGGFQNIPGHEAFTPAERAFIEAGGTMQGALAKSAAEKAGRAEGPRSEGGNRGGERAGLGGGGALAGDPGGRFGRGLRRGGRVGKKI